MEKKSIGAFIAVLRKVNGMTQRDLADRLGVSDKTVSHWERDDSAPDLTLIPVIAEIFGVTCDELLRGERIMYASEEASPKTEKLVRHLLSLSRGKFKTRSMISLGLSVAGLLAAMILNFGANSAYIGFFIGCIFWAAAIICEFIFYFNALFAVSGEDFGADAAAVFGNCALNDYKIYSVRLAGKTISASVIMLGASLPLFIIPYDTFQGVTANAWLLWGLLAAAVTSVVCLGVVHAVNDALIRKGVYKLDKSADIKRHENNRLKIRCIAVICAILFVLALGQAAFNGALGADAFAAGTTFDNFEDFKEYMETEKDGVIYTGDAAALQRAAAYNEEYYDINGNPTSKEEALTEYIYDGDGNVLYQYVHLNQEVTFTRYSGLGTDVFSITAYTSDQLQSGQATKDFINARLLILYFIVIGAGFLVYFKKKRKNKTALL